MCDDGHNKGGLEGNKVVSVLFLNMEGEITNVVMYHLIHSLKK